MFDHFSTLCNKGLKHTRNRMYNVYGRGEGDGYHPNFSDSFEVAIRFSEFWLYFGAF